MNARGMAVRLGERLIRRAVRRLPAEDRGEWFMTYAAELPAFLDDPAIRPVFRRYLRMVLHSADSIRGSWRHRGDLAAAGLIPAFAVASAVISVGAAISVGSAAVLAVGVITADIHLTLVVSEFVFGGLALLSAFLFTSIAIARWRRTASRDGTPPGGA